jgi:hypothetical protein
MFLKLFSRRLNLSLCLVALLAIVFIWTSTADAKYIIYFKTGGKRVVTSYRVEGDTIRIYAGGGWIGYPRSFILKIEKVENVTGEEDRRRIESERRIKQMEMEEAARAKALQEKIPDAPQEGDRELGSLVYSLAGEMDNEWVPLVKGVYLKKGIYTPGDELHFKLVAQGGMKKKILKVTAKFDYDFLPSRVLYQAGRPDWYRKLKLPEEGLADADLNGGLDEVECLLKIPANVEPRDIGVTFIIENVVALYMTEEITYFQGESENPWILHIAYPGEKEQVLAAWEEEKQVLAAKERKKSVIIKSVVTLVVLIVLIVVLVFAFMTVKKGKVLKRQKEIAASLGTPREEIDNYIQYNLFAASGGDERLETKLRMIGIEESVAAIQEAVFNSANDVQARAALAQILGKIGGPWAFPYLVKIVDEKNPDDDMAAVQLGAVLGLGYSRDSRAIDRLMVLSREEGRLGEFAQKALYILDHPEEDRR